MRKIMLLKSVLVLVLLGIVAPSTFAKDNSETDKEIFNEIFEEALEDIENASVRKKVNVFFHKNYPNLLAEIKKVKSEDDRDEIIDFLEDEFEELAEHLDEEHVSDSTILQNWINYKSKEYESLIIGRRIMQLRKRSSPDSAEIANEEANLKKTLKELFDLRLKHEEKEIYSLELELKKLKQIHKKRQEKKDVIIEKRFNELTGNDDIYDW